MTVCSSRARGLGIAKERAVHGAARAAGADQVAAAKDVVDDQTLAIARITRTLWRSDLARRALEQPGVELEAPDRVLHAGHREAAAPEVHLHALEREEAVRVRGHVHLEVPHHLGRDPAGAELEARESFLVEHEHVGAARAEPPRRRLSPRSAADDQHVDVRAWLSQSR